MLKLMNSSGVTESGESEKVFLLIESGVRLHTTAYVRYAYSSLVCCYNFAHNHEKEVLYFGTEDFI